MSGSGYGILTITPNGDITYNHIVGTNCTVADNFIINAEETSGGGGSMAIPIWLIVLLSVIGLIIIVGVVWFCFWKKKDDVKEFINSDLEANYKSMEMRNGV